LAVFVPNRGVELVPVDAVIARVVARGREVEVDRQRWDGRDGAGICTPGAQALLPCDVARDLRPERRLGQLRDAGVDRGGRSPGVQVRAGHGPRLRWGGVFVISHGEPSNDSATSDRRLLRRRIASRPWYQTSTRTTLSVRRGLSALCLCR